MPPPHSLLEAEVKQREIAAKLDALNQRQAARERDAGRPGVGSRAQLEKRLRELQKAKAAKKAAAAATAGGDGPSASASLFSLHSSNTADAPSSLEWAERLRQAKAKYWANLDQLAPEWKSNSQHRRLEQLAKYEQAIDALLVRRQNASLAYAKERELQKMLTEKQLELAQLAIHEREEVRARQEARYKSEGLPQPPTLAQQVNSSARAHFLDEQATRPVSPPMPPPARQQPMYDGAAAAAAAGAGPDAYYRDEPNYSQQQQQQAPSYRNNDSGYSRASQQQQQQQQPSQHQQYYPPRGPVPSFSVLPDDAALDAEYHASRVERGHRDVLDLEAWRQESAAEVALRRSRREERELADMRERRVAMERRKAQEMEQEEHIRLMMLNKQTARMHEPAMVGPPSPQRYNTSSSTMHPPQAQPQPRFNEVQGEGLSYHQSTAAAPAHSTFVTAAEPMPAARPAYSSNYPPSPVAAAPAATAAPARHYSSGTADPSAAPSSFDSDRGYFDEHRRLDLEARQELQRQQEEDRAMDERARMREEQERRDEDQRRQQQQQQQQQQEQQRQQQEQQRVREQQQREQQQREAEAARARADAAAAAAAEAQAQSARDAAAAAAAASSAAPPSPNDEDAPAPVSSLFGGGSSLGFLGKGRKKPAQTRAGATTTTAAATRPATAPIAAAAASAKPATAAAAVKKKAAGSDDDTSDEDESELKTVPALSSAMLLKKKSAPGRINSRPTWSTDEFDASNKQPTRAATLPEDDEFADF